jgi:hypothetical protein
MNLHYGVLPSRDQSVLAVREVMAVRCNNHMKNIHLNALWIAVRKFGH